MARMRVVELDGDLLRERAPIGIASPEAAHEIGERAGDQKILLHEAQSLPHAGRVVRIEHARQRLGAERLRHRADEVAVAECLKVEVIRRSRGPEPERIDGLAAIAHDRADRTGCRSGWTAGPATTRNSPARTSNEQFSLTSTFSCGRATSHGSWPAEPVVRLLALPAVLDGLFEDAVFVSQAVAHGRQLHGRHRVQEAGRQSAEPAIAQRRVRLLLEQLDPVDADAAAVASRTTGSSRRFVTLLASDRPMRNSIER